MKEGVRAEVGSGPGPVDPVVSPILPSWLDPVGSLSSPGSGPGSTLPSWLGPGRPVPLQCGRAERVDALRRCKRLSASVFRCVPGSQGMGQ